MPFFSLPTAFLVLVCAVAIAADSAVPPAKDAEFRSCCEKESVDASLVPLCNYTLMLEGLELQNSGPLLDTAKLHTDLRSAAVLPTLNLGFAKCYTKEKDVSGCCREAGVSEDCLVACNGSLLNGPKSSGTDFFRCMADFGSLAQTTVKAIKCFALA